MDKYCCPLCGGDLYISQEHFYEVKQKINNSTGKVQKRINRKYYDTCDTLAHICCDVCNFSYNIENTDYPEINELLESALDDENCKIFNSDVVYF